LDADHVRCSRAREEERRIAVGRNPPAFIYAPQSQFPASTVRGAISLDGQRVDVHWQVREGINGLVEEASATFGLRLSESASLYFTREGRASFGGVEQSHCFARDQVLNAVGISENAREKSSNLRVF
jgi:hypothetical protein